MRGLALCAVVLFSTAAFADVSLTETSQGRSATLLEGGELDATWKTSATPPLRLTDDWRLARAPTPAPLDEGGGVSSELRQILALVLGFVPGFGLGHLIARDRDGFILFLIIDIALYALGVTLGVIFHSGPFWGLGGVVWLVVHIIQALDAYAEAGGERIVQLTREKAVAIASAGEPPGLRAPQITTRIFGFSF